MRKTLIYILIIAFGSIQAQELNATVTINSDRIVAVNQQIFKTLQKTLTELLNNTKWTTTAYKGNEKIDCSFFLTINTLDVDKFTGILQVQASRPVYNSNYMSPLINIEDEDINFNYTEFQNLIFDPNSFDSNLVSLLAFYANIIIGVDADSYSLEGGSNALNNAQNIVNVAQQSQIKGWSQGAGYQNRYFLINDMLSTTYAPFRKSIYEYHRSALDLMSNDQKEGKEGVIKALKTLAEVGKVRPNAYLTRVFFDAKVDEIVNIYSGGVKVEIKDFVDILNRLSPTNSSKWGEISY
jgi:hypothetical protein